MPQKDKMLITTKNPFEPNKTGSSAMPTFHHQVFLALKTPIDPFAIYFLWSFLLCRRGERSHEREMAMHINTSTKSEDIRDEKAVLKERRERWNFYLSVVRTAFAAASFVLTLVLATAWWLLGIPTPPF
jgi:hypothetical protein